MRLVQWRKVRSRKALTRHSFPNCENNDDIFSSPWNGAEDDINIETVQNGCGPLSEQNLSE